VEAQDIGNSVRELRLHGRGGQGTVKASEIIVFAAVRDGLFANSIPYFGFERRGAPVSAFVRLDRQPIRPKTQVYSPDCVLVMDNTLLRAVNVFDGLKPGGTLVLNSSGIPSRMPPQVGRVASIDATTVSLDILGRSLPNTVMLGAFAAATGWVKADSLADRAAEVFGPQNADAVWAGYEGVEITALGTPDEAGASTAGQPDDLEPAGAPGSSPAGRSSHLDYVCPIGRELYVIDTGDWRTYRPVLDATACTRCGLCLLYCPVGAIGTGADGDYDISLKYCKGCGICAHECPRDAITMVKEGG